MKVWAIVPVKDLSRAKSRLSVVLTVTQRQQLVLAMLRHTLAVLTQVAGLAQVLVVSATPRVGAIAQTSSALFLPEAGVPGLNCSLQRAVVRAQTLGAESVLIVPADLPLVVKFMQ